MPRRARLFPLLLFLALGCATLARRDLEPFLIHVIDAQGRPVPCVALKTTQKVVLTTDADGVAAFWEPGQMHRVVYFQPKREGFEAAPDPTGVRGQAFQVRPGGSGAIVLTQTGPAGACDAPPARTYPAVASRAQLFRIDVVDAATGRGVPLVELTAPSGASFLSDSQGVIAFDDLSEMGRPLRFTVSADGYRLRDPSGEIELEPRAGGHAVIEVDRTDIAERLYRLTGAGIYRDSVRLGLDVPIEEPLVNADVAGQDSVQATLYDGRVFWVWGDTPGLSHPLWNFHTSGATSKLPADGGLDPSVGVDLDYFVDGDGKVRAMAPIPGPGATWLAGLVNVPDAEGEETLFAFYAKHTKLEEADESGLARFDPERQIFERAVVFDDAQPIRPGATAGVVDGRDGRFVHYGDDIRIPARAESFADPSSWQAYSPFPAPGAPAERDADGRVRYDWRAGAAPVSQADLAAGRLAADETVSGHVRDVQTGAPIQVHAPTTSANDYRGRFVRIFTQRRGNPSQLGEIWYVEGDTPMGPWQYARKVVSHRNYSYYNPALHPFFEQRGGRTLYFEGTYTASFSAWATPTPRYDYNQLMHRLDLEDPRLRLPVAIYDLGDDGRPERFADKRALRPGDGDPPVAFFAYDRPVPGSVPVWWSGAACAERKLVAGPGAVTTPLFFAYPAEARPAETPTRPLVIHPPSLTGKPPGAPLVFVYENLSRVRLPVANYLPATIADAGPDQCLREASPGAGARVALDGTGSLGPEGVALDFAWSWPGGTASGPQPELVLPAGLHELRLTVSTPEGASASDRLVVEVAKGPQTSKSVSR